MASLPQISVIIPTYNRIDYLCEAIDSVLQQTYQDFELIVVDDGSTDNTRVVLKKYGTRISYLYQDNQGPPAAMNTGVRHSTGEYFAVLGNDDLWMPDFLEKQTRALDQNPDLAFVFSGAHFIDENGKVLKTSESAKGRALTFVSLLESNFVFHLTVLMRRKYYDEAGGFDEGLLTTHDYDLWLRTSSKYPFAYTPEVLAQWRTHENNFSKKFDLHLCDHLAIFRKKEIKGHVGILKWRNCMARMYYGLGMFYSKNGQYVQAGNCYLKSIFYSPVIGVYFWPPETKNMKFSLPYRLVRVYFLPFYFWVKTLLRKVN